MQPSAVMRSCEIFGIQELNVNNGMVKVLIKKLPWALKNGLTLIPMIVLQLA
jgi:hypothetical protein